ncbi:hypothetical protein [Sulfurimonas sp.]|uniref:phage neck terminator protein n=1 Tax=Sulfurimonas sp. TaxID=2022749 RepID=UPI00356A3819
MILVTLAEYITELMSFDADKVIVGRENGNQKIFSNDYIVVDTLSVLPQAHGREYEYDTEIETRRTSFQGTFTIEFYGPNSETNAYKFTNIQSAQAGKDLEKSKNITVYRPSSLNNLKQQLGNKYFDRIEIEILVQYNQSFEIDTLRIEEIPVEYTQE